MVVKPSARETFTPRQLASTYRDFTEGGPQYVDAQYGLKASAYRFGTRVLMVYEEAEIGEVLLMRLTSQDEMRSRSVDTDNPGYIDHESTREVPS